MICGAIVDLEREVYARHESVPYRCAKCPKSHKDGTKFCGECGLRFVPVASRRWLPEVRAGLVKIGIDIDDDKEADVRDFDDGPFYRVDAIQSSEDTPNGGTWALGVQFAPSLASNDYRRTGAVCFPRAQIVQAMATVEVALRRLGLSEREICLFPVMYLSV